MTHMVRVESNLKQGVDVPLSHKTLIVGPNRSGKTSVLQAIELAIANTVSDLEGRDTVKAQQALMRVFPLRLSRFFSAVEMSDGTQFEWSLNTSSTGKKGKPEKSLPYHMHFLSRELAAALRGNGSTIRKYMFKHVCGADVWPQVYWKLSGEQRQVLESLAIGNDPSAHCDPEIIAALIRSKALSLGKQAKGEAQVAEALLVGTEFIDEEARGALVTEQSTYAVALRERMSGMTSHQYASLEAEIDEAASRVAAAYSHVSVEEIPEHQTQPLLALYERQKSAVICRSGDLVRDLIDVTTELAEHELYRRLYVASTAKMAEYDSLTADAAMLKKLAGAISKLGESCFASSMTAYCKQVSQYLPEHFGSYDIDLDIMRIGLYGADGSFRSALSGAEQVAVHMAMSSVFPVKEDGVLGVITSPDVAWDKHTLTESMKALAKSPHQIVLTSTVFPRIDDVEGWSIVRL